MPHSYTCNLMHCTFSTKERYPWIDLALERELWPYIGGIARKNRMKALAIDGVFDHLHALLSLPSTMSFAKAVQLIKGGSSKWIHDSLRKYRGFEWQEGYGAFSLSASQVKKTIAYINIKSNITGIAPSKRSSSNCSTNIVSNTIRDTYFASFQPSVTRTSLSVVS